MKNIMINIENPQTLLMEISYLNGFVCALNKELPELIELTKIIKQLSSEDLKC